ncbi:putative disease resistance RPP13-like protein 1 [Alnus glutinosa]|uniref:putative disease resistance RPP13-like protein 1 n=1 Tax=Alnus glutinosa TaxID=3517 RepID=UPI002D770EFB|nr:putative disease resistance RPP13-like protein 1 [Alnus glutinosa]XP_062150518.1 putative disease resistance RPP13-like protein 1 [Alnus glutinosa]XP_062150520.1 putative disease resistance RPP13-like protein 1 [Alnus glutinosa]XP_062150521.1 putative disease resistance RPP13-like protein 1 [Alnus glutinosa]XP_062150522.1 putative disease resistance RPP13-like protein 1 [Alnus glutinosa]XP_062150523.1 putative disease resistance RPP13-like protein 1 [Alnus glutinosa]
MEVALEVAGIVLSPFLQVLFERMISRSFHDSLWGQKLTDKLLRKLKIALLTVTAVLEDAEDRQFTETSVKEWLDELKDTVYTSEDILDEIATQDLRRKLDSEFGINILSKVRNPISTSPFDVNKIVEEINDVIDRLEDLAKEIGVLGLRAGVGGQPLERVPTTSLIEESSICGRDVEKEDIIKSLLSDSDDASGSDIGVIAIVGMGGIGKTTLAQLVYNDNKVNEHFDLKAWVYVSDTFDVVMVMKTVLEEVGSLANADSKNLNQLQIKLKETLKGKKFLLVLDDVWNKNYAKWEVLSNALKYGVQKSRIIVTTRDQEVSSVMLASATFLIRELPIEDCWSLFVKYAFHNGNSNQRLQREVLRRRIVEKCKGLPLAIKAIGSLLRPKLDVEEWYKVSRSELWNLPIEETCIIPALRLSYKYLSPNLKRCFAYCSIFPKGYAFERNKLVLLWMAEGFLPEHKNKTMEEVGDDYFHALVSRSLFQQSSGNKYIMHDLVSNLAKFISRQFALSLDDDCSYEIGSKTRHLSYSRKKIISRKLEMFGGQKKSEIFPEAKRLRTVRELSSIWDGKFYMSLAEFPLPKTRCLRVLILSKQEEVTKLPYLTGNLIHLRYLDLSYTPIKSLPGSICKLCNLQTLNLSHCWDLTALPRDMHKLVNLRHLDISGTYAMKEKPKHLDRLKCLRTLTIYEK